MEANKILQADVLDILFDGRNKEYGAYDLRKTYNKRIVYSITGMALLCLSFIGVSIFAKSHSATIKPPTTIVVKLANVKDEVKTPEKIIQPKPQVQPEVAQQKNTTIKVVPNEQVTKEDEVPDNDILENVKIGSVTKDGVQGDIIGVPVEEKGTGPDLAIGTKEEDYTKEFITVQSQAQFPGGFPAWEKFLKRNLRNDTPTENGAPPSSYKVIVSFLVNIDGSISDVRAENDPGYGTADEAVRVIKKSNQWIPAMQNNRNVIYRQKQAITFVVEEQ
jgi:periplasmic protein TonB